MATAALQERDLAPWRELVRADYDEMPGLRLTLKQGQRLWSIDAVTCQELLDSLIETRYLVLTPEGMYCRADCIDGASSLD
jgi:hypothetical protein